MTPDVRMQISLLLAGLAAYCGAWTAAPQPPRAIEAPDRVREVWRIIESFPPEDIGQWRMGGMTFLATSQTDFDYDHEPGVGVIAQVHYIVRDGINVAIQIEPQKRVPARELTDGPYVRWTNENSVEVLSVCLGEVSRSEHLIDGALELFDPCDRSAPIASIELEEPAPAGDVFPAAERVFAVSDVEGHYETLSALLTAAGVIDIDGHWNYGQDHLVFIGDTVDRSDSVTETLWAIRRWQAEARRAGGHVHFLLGNHEAKLLAGWTDDAHLKYHYVAARMGLLIDDLYGPDTELGRWIRSSPTAVRIGKLLFVHGGFPPEVLAEGLTINDWNRRVRTALDQVPDETMRSGDPVWGRMSPLWYRGYFDDQEREFGPRPGTKQIDAELRHFGAEHIIVGHTRVDTVRALYPEDRVLGINVRWRKPEEARGLLREGGRFWQVDRRGRRSPID